MWCTAHSVRTRCLLIRQTGILPPVPHPPLTGPTGESGFTLHPVRSTARCSQSVCNGSESVACSVRPGMWDVDLPVRELVSEIEKGQKADENTAGFPLRPDAQIPLCSAAP